jgi:hypothetical protein
MPNERAEEIAPRLEAGPCRDLGGCVSGGWNCLQIYRGFYRRRDIRNQRPNQQPAINPSCSRRRRASNARSPQPHGCAAVNGKGSDRHPRSAQYVSRRGRHLRVEMRWSVLTTKALIAFFGHKGALAAWCVPGTRLPADHHCFTWGRNTRSTRALIRRACVGSR